MSMGGTGVSNIKKHPGLRADYVSASYSKQSGTTPHKELKSYPVDFVNSMGKMLYTQPLVFFGLL